LLANVVETGKRGVARSGDQPQQPEEDLARAGTGYSSQRKTAPEQGVDLMGLASGSVDSARTLGYSNHLGDFWVAVPLRILNQYGSPFDVADQFFRDDVRDRRSGQYTHGYSRAKLENIGTPLYAPWSIKAVINYWYPDVRFRPNIKYPFLESEDGIN
jgi:hypothetical protein